MAKSKAVVLCSGGLNSTVAAMMMRQDHALALMHVCFGHRSVDKERDLFERQLEIIEAPQHLVIEMPHIASIGGNARVNRKLALEDARAIGDGRSNGYIPGLMSALVSAAFNWAHVIGATKIILGVSEDLGPPAPRTSATFPDYAREHLELLKNAMLPASPQKPITLETPIIDLSRTDIIKLGHRLKAPFELTWSCLSSGEVPCGGCVGCTTRARGFVDAGIPDPILAREPAVATR